MKRREILLNRIGYVMRWFGGSLRLRVATLALVPLFLGACGSSADPGDEPANDGGGAGATAAGSLGSDGPGTGDSSSGGFSSGGSASSAGGENSGGHTSGGEF